MNKRSFRRGMEPELKEGWTRRVVKNDKEKADSLEEALRDTFEEILQNALAEMKRQNEEEGGGRPINSWAMIKWDGSQFKLSIECEPPTIMIDPSLN